MSTARARWSTLSMHNLQADLADAVDQVDQLQYDLLLRRPLDGELLHLKQDITDIFGAAPDVAAQRFRCAGGLQGLAVFDPALVNQELLVLGVLDRISRSPLAPSDGGAADLLDRVSEAIAPTGDVTTTGGPPTAEGAGTLGSLAEEVLGGAVVVCFSGCRHALAIKIGQADKRAIAEPPSAPAVIGPREGFIEDYEVNLSLIRRRLRSPRLRVEEFRLGTISRTSVYLLHLHGITDDLLVAEARRRLQGVRIDGVMESNTLMELIRDAPGSPVPTMLRSERPDRVASALLQGQIAIVTDGTPFVLLAPITVGHLLKASEDYYENWVAVTLVRGIRLIALLLGVFLPAFYVSIVTFHPEFIPPLLLTTIAASRENVPLPAFGEVLLIMGLFEIIREAGVRVPAGIGNALTIGGTLVVGEAAVRAGLVSTPVIIIGSAVVIAFFAIPSYDMVQFSRFLLYPMLLAAAFLGMYGILFMAFLLAFYLASIRSFGVAFLAPLAPMRPSDWKDALLRAPWWAMNFRPAATGYTNPVRQGPRQRPEPPGAMR